MGEERLASVTVSESYPLWLIRRLCKRSIPRIWRTVMRILRPTLWLGRLAMLAARVLLLLESGVLLLSATVLGAILLPPLAVVLLLGLALTALRRRRAAEELAPLLAGRHVLVFDAEDRGEDAFFLENARDLAAIGYTVMLVSAGMGRGFFRIGEGEIVHLAPSLYFKLLALDFFSPARLILIGA